VLALTACDSQLHALLSTLGAHARKNFKRWQDSAFRELVADIDVSNDDDIDSVIGRRFFDPEHNLVLTPELARALQRHFASRLIGENVPGSTITLQEVKTVTWSAYTAYDSGPAGANQIYRTPGNRRDGGKRDASWVMVRSVAFASRRYI
jgi:hypothetical protein